MGKVGWVVQEFQFERYQASVQTMRISKAIIEIVKAILSPSEIQTVERVLESLQSQGNEPWWVAFDSKSTGPSLNGNFQVAPAVKILLVRWWWHWLLSTLQLQSGRTAGYGLTTAPLISTSSRLLKSQHSTKMSTVNFIKQ